jgi:hypothetical protein
VLDGGPGVIAKEGLGLAGIEDIVMAAMLEDLCSISDTHTQVPDAYQPALNTLPNETCNRDHVSGRQRMSHSIRLYCRFWLALVLSHSHAAHDPYSVLKLVALKGSGWIDNPSSHTSRTKNFDRLSASLSNRIAAHIRSEQDNKMS